MAENRRLWQLDGLRGLAALAIAFFHLGMYQFPKAYEALSGGASYFDRFYLLVDWFFVLSGFVMALRYREIFKNEVKSLEFGRYIFKRFTRLYPVHLLVLLLLVGMHWILFPLWSVPPDPFAPIRNGFSVLTNLFMLHSSGIGDQGCYNCTSWNYPSWSISVEWICYFFLPPFIVFARRSTLMAWGIFVFLIGVLYFVVEKQVSHLDVASWQGIVRCGAGMAFGVLIQMLYERGVRLNAAARGAIVVSLGLGVHFIESDTALVFFMGPVVLAFASSSSRGILASGPLVWLGRRSYCIYMVHVLAQDLISFCSRLVYGMPTQEMGTVAQSFGLGASMGLTLFFGHLFYAKVELLASRVLNEKASHLWHRESGRFVVRPYNLVKGKILAIKGIYFR